MAYVNHAHARLFYEVYGTGGPVVFGHGGEGNSLSWWNQVPYFARKYRVLTFDHRGFGRTEISSVQHMRVTFFADDLKAILDDAEIERAALVCQSMAGMYVLTFAQKYRERVACIVLTHTPAGINTPTITGGVTRAFAHWLKQSEQHQENVLPWEIDSNLLTRGFQDQNPACAFLHTQIQKMNMIQLGQKKLVEQVAFWEMFFPPERLDGYSVPTLVIAGEKDMVTPPDLMKEVTRLIPGAEMEEIQGVGHCSYLERPDTFNELVDRFISKHIR